MYFFGVNILTELNHNIFSKDDVHLTYMYTFHLSALK